VIFTSHLYLPIILDKYPFGPTYCEENDTQETACSLDFGQTYDFKPDDEDDWYSVVLPQTASLDVLVTDYLPELTNHEGQLVVYKTCFTCEPPREFLGHDARGLSTMHVPGAGNPYALRNLSPGIYYIRVYNPVETGTALYHITVTYQLSRPIN
jgi:hypothetical protein